MSTNPQTQQTVTDALLQSVSSEQLSSVLKACADRLRLEILRVLNKDSYGVLELCTIFDMKQSGMSHHLKVLANAGLVDSRREGNSIFYRRSHQAQAQYLESLQQALLNTVDQLPLDDSVLAGIAQIQQERATQSQKFFTENADKFRAQQDLIAAYPQYAESVSRLLDSVPLPGTEQAVEIGPGDGAFLSELASRFSKVTAIDNSPDMLQQARQFVDRQQLANVECLLGDSQLLQTNKLKADCIVVNMVLHHTPSPAEIFRDLAASLKPGGALLVTDLCRHDQAWARENCGDLWLGFEPEDLNRWANDFKLETGQEMYLALRNGFQIQIRHFYKPKTIH